MAKVLPSYSVPLILGGYRRSLPSRFGVNNGITKMGGLPKQVLLGCVFLFALAGQTIADALSDAQIAYSAGNYAKAAKLLRPLAKQGNAWAQFNLGVMYDEGKGIAQNYKEAAKWYRLAAEQGDSDAQYNLGIMYFNGEGVPQDSVRAHMCATVAMYTNSGEKYSELRNSVAKVMTPLQITKAKQLAKKCVVQQFKGCW